MRSAHRMGAGGSGMGNMMMKMMVMIMMDAQMFSQLRTPARTCLANTIPKCDRQNVLGLKILREKRMRLLLALQRSAGARYLMEGPPH